MSLKQHQKKPEKVAPTPRPGAKIDYQSGYNAERQAVNSGQVLADYEQNAFFGGDDALTSDGARGVADLNNQMTDNAMAQMGRSLEAQNAQKNMNDQMVRSELTQQGLANQAQIYSDISQRAVDQMGLAAKLQEAQIRNNFAVANQRAMQIRKNMPQGYSLDKSATKANDLLKGSLLS